MSDLLSGERQVAPTLSGIRRDHRARYEWAARQLPPGSRVADLACGIGYGAHILAEAGHRVFAVDRSASAIAYGERHFPHERITYRVADVGDVDLAADRLDAVISFETIEHLADPLPALRSFRRAAPLLLASVPNQRHFPYTGQQFHHRHYTAEQFAELLFDAGYSGLEWFGQVGMESDVEPAASGRTIVTAARRAPAVIHRFPEKSVTEEPPQLPIVAAEPPLNHVVILGLGGSLAQFINVAKCGGGRLAGIRDDLGNIIKVDEVWGINALGDIIRCDRVFHMDDVRIQESRAEAYGKFRQKWLQDRTEIEELIRKRDGGQALAPDEDGRVRVFEENRKSATSGGNIGPMLDWLRTYPGLVYTSRAHEGYPNLVEYPLQDVLNTVGFAYFNSTAAYAVAYAIHRRVRMISIFGCDFTYPNAHHAEKGRACLEFWLGMAAARGIDFRIARNSTLMDAYAPERERLYGYDTLDVAIATVNGRAEVTMKPRDVIPTAEEIEDRYDHEQHPARGAMDEEEAA